jgi:predicted acylesterase/phospholipase RssA
MKGGITSGVVYPLAVVELARRYAFKSIGGTSAGAIAAALTAAAELRRRAGSDAGFEILAALPEVLQTRLVSLFQPSRAGRSAFRLLLAVVGRGPVWKRTWSALLALLRTQALFAAIGTALAVLVIGALLALVNAAPSPRVLGSLCGLAAIAGALAGASAAFLWRTPRALSANFLGLCRGLREGGRDEALTEWLVRNLDQVAGKGPGDPPLTFGELWRGQLGGRPEGDAAPPAIEREIDLEVVTCNLTHGRPYRIPFESRAFYFKPAEFRRLFPEPIVEFLKRHSAPARFYEPSEDSPWRLPAPADLPVVVAVRLSLSFPLLLSAVPLNAVDWSRASNQDKRDDSPLDYERCWFSDGGIGSNFPIHFFDALLPRRPTFGLNLRPFPLGQEADHQDQSKNVHFPRTSQSEVVPDWNRFEGVLGFLRAIVETMQNWVDSTQMKLPGYHDRVVHIELEKEEGGLNLEMPKERIAELTERGAVAGRLLVEQFDWDRHRWTRYRTAFSQIQDVLDGMDRAWTDGSGPSGDGFGPFLEARDPAAPPYALARGRRGRELVRDFVALGPAWREAEVDFRSGAPRPDPELKVRPRI